MDPVNFMKIDAEEIYDEVIKQLKEGVAEVLHPGDERLLFGETLVAVVVNLFNTINDAARQRLLRYARGNILDALGERLDTPRIAPSKAVAKIRFHAVDNYLQNIVISAGTRVTSDNVHYFVTKQDALISPGSSTKFVDVLVEAAEGGSTYNGYGSDDKKITTLVDLIPQIKKIESLEESHGGDDGETYDLEGDNNYRERIKLAPSKLSTAGSADYYKYHALKADPNIVSVSVESDEPGKVKIVVFPRAAEGVELNDVLERVQAACDDPKIRPLTDEVTVEGYTTRWYQISLTFYVKRFDSVAEVEANVDNAVKKYIEWQSAELGRAIDPDKLKHFIFHSSEGLAVPERVVVHSPEYEEIEKNKIAQCETTHIATEYI